MTIPFEKLKARLLANPKGKTECWAGWAECMWSGTGPKFGSVERSRLASLAP